MITSVPILELSKPQGRARIPEGVRGYVEQKLRQDLYHLVLTAFRESGATQVDLAHRLGKDPAVVNRNLGAPGNWKLDTASDLLYAINGNIISVSQQDPSAAVAANYTKPYWLSDDVQSFVPRVEVSKATAISAPENLQRVPTGNLRAKFTVHAE